LRPATTSLNFAFPTSSVAVLLRDLEHDSLATVGIYPDLLAALRAVLRVQEPEPVRGLA